MKTPPAVEEPERSIADKIAARKKALTVGELADILCLAPTTVYGMAKTKRLPAIRIGASLRFDPKATADWLRTQMVN